MQLAPKAVIHSSFSILSCILVLSFMVLLVARLRSNVDADMNMQIKGTMPKQSG